MNADDSTRKTKGQDLGAADSPEEELTELEATPAASQTVSIKPVSIDDSPDPDSADDKDGEVEDEDEDEEEDDSDQDSSTGEESEDGTDDPMAPAFDLEQGDIICKQTAVAPDRSPSRSIIETAKEFFNAEILYRFDIIEPEDRKALKGTCRIELRGQDGGVWTLNIGDELSVNPSNEEEVDVTLTMQQQDFVSIVNGMLNPQLALLSQKMKVDGNLKHAFALQTLLAPAQE